jgi:hypothetical protein
MTMPIPEAAAGVLETDVPCRKCSYNLRGLSADGRCPECGTPVGLSVQGDFLRYSDPAWLGTLRRGVNLIIWGVVEFVVGAVITIFFGPVIGPAVMVLVMLAGTLLMLAGWWQLTAPDPSGIGEDRYGTARKVIRVALVVGLVATPLQWLEKVVPSEVGIVLQVLSFLAGVVGIVGVIAQLQYLRKLALRIPDDKLSGRAHFLTYALAITYGLLIVMSAIFGLAVRASGGGGPAGPFQALGCFMGIVGLAMIVFGIMYLLLIEKMGKRFKEQAAYARQTWAAGGGAAQG